MRLTAEEAKRLRDKADMDGCVILEEDGMERIEFLSKQFESMSPPVKTIFTKLWQESD